MNVSAALVCTAGPYAGTVFPIRTRTPAGIEDGGRALIADVIVGRRRMLDRPASDNVQLISLHNDKEVSSRHFT